MTRVTVDEAHSIFLCESYRPTMQSLVHLREVPGQKVFLTATLAPRHESILAKPVGISLTNTLALRLPTARPNHQLQVARIETPEKVSAAGVQLASLLLDEWREDPGVRGIIFVRTLKDLEEFSGSCPFPTCTFYGRMSNEQKDSQLNSWFSTGHPAKWMVSTTALLHGVDYPQVNAVIFLECPFGLYDFVQGAGRGGRGGQEALVAILYSGFPDPLPNESLYGCRKEMEEILTSPSCRRLGISKVMDGKELPCSQVANSLLCDICEGRLHPVVTKAIEGPFSTPILHTTAVHNHLSTPHSTPIEEPLPTPAPHTTAVRTPPNTPPLTPTQQGGPPTNSNALLKAFTAQRESDLRVKHADSVKELLVRFGGCFACRINTPDHRPCHPECGNSGGTACLKTPHRIFNCPGLSYPHQSGWIDWKKIDFRWRKDVSRCYFCGLPNSVANFHSNQDGKGCKFGDSALAAAWHILNTPDLFRDLQKELGFAPKGNNARAEFGAWLTDYGPRAEDIRMLSVFAWLCRRYYPGTQLNPSRPCQNS